MSDVLQLGLEQYGLPVLFVTILLAAIGAPLPATLLLLTAGALAGQGYIAVWWVVGSATVAALLGDCVGYAIGRWGNRRFVAALERWSGAERLQQAEQTAGRWGGAGIFLSRWLLTPIGPLINLASGLARYPRLAFAGLALAGEALWACVYVALGRLFAEQIETLSTNLGYATWIALGVVAALLAAKLVPRRQSVAEAI